MIRTHSKASLIAIAALAGSLLACSKERETPDESAATASTSPAVATAFALSFSPTDAEKTRAEELAKTVNRQRHVLEGTKDAKADLKPLLWLAATSPDENVQAATLKTLSKDINASTELQADLAAAAKQYVASSDKEVATQALQLTSRLITGPEGQSLLNAMIAFAHELNFASGPGRHELLLALGPLGAEQPALKQLLLESLDDSSPGPIVEALEQLRPRTGRAVANPELAKKVLPLMRHLEPAVRGEAAATLGKTARGVDEAIPELLGALEDTSPFVRSRAAWALADLRYKPAVHALVGLTTDNSKDLLNVSYPTLSGSKRRRVLSGATRWPHVSHVAQLALFELGRPTLKLIEVAPIDVDGSLKKNALTVKKWYAANKSQFDAPVAAAPPVVPPEAAAEETASTGRQPKDAVSTKAVSTKAASTNAAKTTLPAKAPAKP